jgi:carboxylesterase type B
MAVVSSYYDVARGSGWSVLDGVLQWGPVLDPEQLPAQPMAVIAARALPGPPVDVLVGHNTDEVGTFLDTSHYAASYPTLVYETVLLSIFGIRGSSTVKAQYARYGLPAGVEQLDLIMTDYWFKCAKEDVAAAVSAAGGQAWSYRFHHNISFGPEIWVPVGLPQCVTKVCHTAELVFVFGNTGDWEFSEEERGFSDTLIDAWTNFAHTGNPNEPPQRVATARRALRQASGLNWPQFSNDTRLSLVLRPGWDVEDSNDVCEFWDGMGYASH